MQIQAINASAVAATLLQPDAGAVRSPAQAGASAAAQEPAAAHAQNLAQTVAPAGSGGQESVAASVQKLNDMATSLNVNVQFSVDAGTQMQVVTVVDSSTKEVIRQIPSQTVIDIAKAIDKFQGMLVREQA